MNPWGSIRAFTVLHYVLYQSPADKQYGSVHGLAHFVQLLQNAEQHVLGCRLHLDVGEQKVDEHGDRQPAEEGDAHQQEQRAKQTLLHAVLHQFNHWIYFVNIFI